MDKTALFIDVVGSVKLYQQLGNQQAEELINSSAVRISGYVASHSGRVIKSIGDCVMAELPGPDQAAAVAFEVNRNVREALQKNKVLLRFRAGFCSGPVIERNGDIFGDVVNIAARLCSMAKYDEILTPQQTARMLTGEYAEAARIYDHTTLKGVKEPMTIVSLMWDRRGATEVFSQSKIFMAPLALSGAFEQRLMLRHQDCELTLSPQDLPISLGRDEACKLVVATRFASRTHLRIEHQRGKFVLIDESSNGTYVLPANTAEEPSLLVKHESFTLIGEGRFALGQRPELGENVLTYRVMLKPGAPDPNCS